MKKIKRFNYGEFDNNDFVFNQDKYSKEEALSIAQKETDSFDDYTVEDVKEAYVAYRFDPSYCQHEFDSNGAYFYVPKGSRGSFPVWVIPS